MSTYQELRGLKVKYLAANPDPGSKGDVWYDSATFELKGFVGRAAWSAGAPLISVQRDGGYGSSTPTSASWLAGGVSPARNQATTQEYNGTGWASGGDLNTGREEGIGFGTQTAAVHVGGATYPPSALKDEVEEYNGSSWTEVTDLPANRKKGGGFGTLTAGVVGLGRLDPPSSGGTNSATSLEYDGTNWTAGGAASTARAYVAASGTLTAGLVVGGEAPSSSVQSVSEEYNGTAWTSGGSLNTARWILAGNGTQISAVVYGGDTGSSTYTVNTEMYDGSSWTETSNLSTARARLYGGGSDGTQAVASGGLTATAVTNITEEFNNTFNVVTAGAWASMTNFPDTRAYAAASGGTPSSSLVFGGYDGAGLGGFVSSGAEWDGSSWTGTGDYPIDVAGVAGLGPVTAGLGCGGYKDNATNVTTTAEYDGSSWTAGNNANAVGQGAKMAGTQTAGSMGNRSGDENGHEQYNGSTWTAATDTPVAASAGAMMAGTQSALLMYGGEASNKKRTESWDGSSWTTLNNMNLDRRQGAHGGTQTIAIAGGGDTSPGVIATTELWDGTSWVSGPNMATARFYQVGGTSTGSGVTSCIAATGRPASATLSNTCEEFTGETIAETGSTIDFD